MAKAPAVIEHVKGVFATDLHGDQQDKTAVAALARFCDQWKPDLRVFGGDAWDFRQLRKKASPEERRESMRKDFRAGVDFFESWRPTHFLRGNHCERLWEARDIGDGIVGDYAADAVDEVEALIRSLGCKMLPYHKKKGVLRFGHLKLLHGFYVGINAARRHALCYGSCAFGHVHAIDQQTVEGYDIRMAQAVGCLCSLDMPYLHRCPGSLRHSHGFMPFAYNKRSGLFHTFQAKEINGTWNFDVFSL